MWLRNKWWNWTYINKHFCTNLIPLQWCILKKWILDAIFKFPLLRNLCEHPHLSHCITKPTKWPVCPAKTQISLGICPVWSESSLSALRNVGSLATIKHIAKTLTSLGRYLGWFESSLGAQVILLGLSCCSSFLQASCYPNGPNYSNRRVWTNSVDPD